MDEFAEAHCKEIHVREWFAGTIAGCRESEPASDAGA
jgi:hypothetical protein